MWTRVALRVTTPLPLHTLLGSRSENIQKQESLCHSSSSFKAAECFIQYPQGALLLGIIISYRYHMPQKTEIEL